MAGFAYTRQFTVGGSAVSSTITFGPFLTADWNNISLSVQTGAAVASSHTLQGSNDDGFFSSINTWSNLSVVAAAGLVKLDNGMRWLRILKPSADSTTVYSLEGRSY